MPILLYAAAGVWVVGMLAFARANPAVYEAALQEDRFVEWWTVGLFAAAAAVRFRKALGTRRAFDFLVALFCLFVAGEEFSWGQRLLGFTPPAVFLENNTQQELTLHNFADVFGKPKGVLILALLGYGALLPLGARLRSAKGFMERIGASAPAAHFTPLFLLAALLLHWYPADYTGEWVETLAGGLFLASAARPRRIPPLALGAAIAALLLTAVSAYGRRATPYAIGCAQAEADALARDIADGGAARARLRLRDGSVHKRLWSAAQAGYIAPERLAGFHATGCAEPAAERREHLVDPWGMAYWLRAERPGRGGRRLIVYSMGPNRRRDGAPGARAGDDVSASVLMSR